MPKRQKPPEEDDDDTYFEDPLGAVVDSVLGHPTITGALNRFTAALDKAANSLHSRQETTKAKRPVQRPVARPVQRPKEDPRMILGFGPTVKLTEELIRERRKALAALYHPDHQNGSQEAMMRVNQAADALLNRLRGAK